ncbi:MAG: bifunctional folylpolyglutamate synthase/dihydrofolate synthase [Tannerellaceae bacterium]|jgi:dihydrofolate synthase/folylpolyglutamate synthase|nr:bifunctional folylpolyglutamate synthase/dihydrofolate synthase [Tannerellaceae bacterium]
MTYDETLAYLYASTPVFQFQGAPAYKPGLDTSIALDNHLNNPHRSFRTIHVAGTNGKGTVCHTLAAILQEAGYRVGLFTSPHLTDFRERIRVNGEMIGKDYVVDFTARHRAFFEPLKPSFFELTSALAFDYFRFAQVDFALIEVGLGGRLDSTNIITPIVSVVTSIGMDHTQFLGNTLPEIAAEKAGIIKSNVPVVVGDLADESLYEIFERKAREMNAPLFRAADRAPLTKAPERPLSPAQRLNERTILSVLHVLAGEHLPPLLSPTIAAGFENVTTLTGLRGRWEVISRQPFTVLDTGHNEEAWRFLPAQIEAACRDNHCKRQILLIGFSEDKDIDPILDRMPPDACYIFTQASLRRALPVATLAAKARKRNLKGDIYPTVAAALQHLQQIATKDDFIFIGGSNFIVADALAHLRIHKICTEQEEI